MGVRQSFEGGDRSAQVFINLNCFLTRPPSTLTDRGVLSDFGVVLELVARLRGPAVSLKSSEALETAHQEHLSSRRGLLPCW